MYVPVKIPMLMVTRILIIFTAFEPAPIVSPLRMRSLLPIKTGMSSFGAINRVARPYIRGRTVGNVDMAPLHSE